MYYSVFAFLLCLFMFLGTIAKAHKTDFYIDGINSTNVKAGDNYIYRYKENERLNITCHELGQRTLKLKWLKNDQTIKGTEGRKHHNNLVLVINKSNDRDILTCHASEDDVGFNKNDKIIVKKINIRLSHHGHDVTTSTSTIAPSNLDDKVKNKEESFLEKLMKNRIFCIVAVIVIVVIILAAILACASKRSYRIKEDKVGLHPAVSNSSVFTTVSRSPSAIPHHKIREDKLRMHPASSASYINSKTLPIPPHRMTNVKVGMHPISSTSYYNTDPRKPTPKIPEECFYTNYDYNKTDGSREVIDEYQEPMDSQAYSYVQTHMYSEPEKQFYTEPIPKILRKPKDNAYVNYNKSNGSANINKNIDLYQNFEEICDNDFDYYTETS